MYPKDSTGSGGISNEVSTLAPYKTEISSSNNPPKNPSKDVDVVELFHKCFEIVQDVIQCFSFQKICKIIVLNASEDEKIWLIKEIPLHTSAGFKPLRGLLENNKAKTNKRAVYQVKIVRKFLFFIVFQFLEFF